VNVSHKHRFVFLANMRTGTRCVFHALRRYFACIGGSHDARTLTHKIGIPAGCERYLVIATVRNPFSRMVSCWNWVREVPGWPSGIDKFVRANPHDFAGFVERAMSTGFDSQSRRLGEIEPDQLIRYERLQASFSELPFVTDEQLHIVPQSPITANWQSWYRPEIEKMVAEKWADDFDRFGYPKVIGR